MNEPVLSNNRTHWGRAGRSIGRCAAKPKRGWRFGHRRLGNKNFRWRDLYPAQITNSHKNRVGEGRGCAKSETRSSRKMLTRQLVVRI